MVMINGQPGRRFYPSRGIHQGDQISLYLFLFVSEGIKLGSGRPIVSHLLFGDDTLVFLKATKPNCDQLVQLLNINFSKSCLVFTPNTPNCMRMEIEDTLNIWGINDPGCLLGSLHFGAGPRRILWPILKT
ncbi:hypothetical protein Prudu_021635 [Prunus dulcis]|uniref:Reverse transcriptase domain-containing protein n=1 Tax=Prunus dulcis TaxID=3755 RepID=A0A4Y1RXT7_PRUDU|nr:hypothetical protein Prudu_021635 [Prunus dulcis]